MSKNTTPTQEYGAELGAGIRQAMQGLNTVCSPKKRKKCIKLIVIPILMTLVGLILAAIGSAENVKFLQSLGAICTLGILGLGLYQFYVGRIFKGILYTITFGGFFIGCLIDLFKLVVTKTFKDANNFPLLY